MFLPITLSTASMLVPDINPMKRLSGCRMSWEAKRETGQEPGCVQTRDAGASSGMGLIRIERG